MDRGMKPIDGMGFGARLYPVVKKLIVLFSMGWSLNSYGQEDSTLNSFKAKIDTIIAKSSLPGAQIAMVHRDSLIWTGNFGLAHINPEIPVTDSTYFRVGSITKSFVGLSALMLMEEGRLDLNQTLREAAPDVEFNNPWEDAQPVRLVHLLEHTTGFDDWHLSEYALNGKGLTLKQGIDFNPNSRISRWPPGTHMQYCNSGPPIMAYVIERITGQSFEAFVQQRIFDPMQMERTSFQLTPWLYDHLASGYSGGEQEVDYWHIGMRPAGSVNSNAVEMASLVRMFLNGGALDSIRLVDSRSIDRMETPTTTLAASITRSEGYGLSNYTHTYNGFTFHGHSGGMDGYLAQYGYSRQLGLGYVTLVNGGDFMASMNIIRTTIEFLTRGLEPPASAEYQPSAEEMEKYRGYFRVANSRVQLAQAIQGLVGIVQVELKDDTLRLNPLLQPSAPMVPVDMGVFSVSGWEGFSTLASFVETKKEGTTLQLVSFPFWINLEKTTWLGAYTPIFITGLVLVILTSVLLYTLAWVALWAAQKDARVNLLLKLFPTLCLLPLLALPLVLQGLDSLSQILLRLGNPTFESYMIFLLPSLFAIFSLASLGWAIRSLIVRGQTILVYYVMTVGLAGCLASGYLAYWGLIGIRLWSY